MALTPAMKVDHFTVLRRLGAGGMSEVWLARDDRLGRKVALKVVRPDVLGTEADRERFLEEARVTARFNHPHIVTIYAVGEVEGQVYLALEYLEGDSLRARLGAAPREALRWGLAIADAMAEAHGEGLVHRDLKPDNVVLAVDGRLRILDFGLARPAYKRRDNERDSVRGTPPYMAPELWLGDAPSPGVDIWAFGAMLYEIISGRPPFEADDPLDLAELVTDPHLALPALADEPPGLAELVRRCLDPAPERRPDAIELVDRIGALLGRHPLEASPFRGLAPFDEDHASLFFGRDAEIAALLERLRTDAFLPILGPSGAGKSSFVAAGVVPRLRERGPLLTLSMRPGRTPLATLAALLQGQDEAELAFGRTTEVDVDQLREAPGLLGTRLRSLAQRRNASVLLIVDQLEEVVTLVHDQAERRGFIDAIVQAADDPLTPVRVVTTLREEFLGRVACSEAAREAFSRITLLRSPGPEALREIVVRPVEVVRHTFDDPTLPDAMVAEVVDEQAGLPLLQFAGQQLWLRRDRAQRLLRRADYEAIGGVAGALARHADGVLSGMTPAQVECARSMLLRLVTDEGTRQVRERGEVQQGLGRGADAVLTALIDARLVVSREHETSSDRVVVELIHESLARTWRRLARWIDESREDLAFLTEVRQAAEVWTRRGRPADEVWSDTALSDALRRANKLDTVPVDVRQFLDAGVGRTRRRRWRRTWLVAGVVIATLAVIATLSWQRQQAVDQRELARREQAHALLAQAEAALDDRRGAEARAALRSALEIEDSLSSRAAWWRALREPLAWELQLSGHRIYTALSPDQQTLALVEDDTVALVEDDTVALLDAATGRTLRVLDDRQPISFGDVQFNADGQLLVRRDMSPVLTLWDTQSGAMRKLVRSGAGLAFEPYTRVGPITEDRRGGHNVFVDRATDEVVGPPSGIELLIAPGSDPVAATATLERYEVRELLSGDLLMDRAAVPASSRRLATIADGTLIGHRDQRWLEWVPWDDGPVHEVELEGWVRGAAMFPDWSIAAIHVVDQGIYMWDPDRGLSDRRLLTWAEPVQQMAPDPAGNALWVIGRAGTLERWDLATGDVTWQTRAHTVTADRLAVGTHRTVTVDQRNLLRVWNTTLAPSGPAEGLESVVQAAAFSRAGDLLATAGDDRRVVLWDVATGPSRGSIVHDAATTTGIDLSADGRWLATSHSDARVRLFDVATGAFQATIEAQGREVRFDPSSGRLAVAGNGTAPTLWSVPGGSQAIALEPSPESRMYWIAWSADGHHIAATSTGHWAGVWDTRTGRLVSSWDGFNDYGWWHVSFLPDGRLFVDDQQSGWACDVLSGNCEALDAPDHSSWWVGGAETAPRVSAGGELQRWDPDSGAVLQRPIREPLGPVPHTWADPTGRLVAVNADEPYVRLFRTDNLRPLWRAEAVLGRELTVKTHNGWDPEIPPQTWAMRDDTEVLVQGNAPTVCRLSTGGEVEVWSDPQSSAPAGRFEGRTPVDVLAHADGCLVRSSAGHLELLRPDGEAAALGEGITLVAVSEARILVATPQEVRVLASDGTVQERASIETGVTAVGWCGTGLCWGYATGRVHVDTDPALDLSGTPNTASTALAMGPGGVLLAGFADGTVGAWDPQHGQPLLQQHLHGRVGHLLVQGPKVLAVTTVGDVARMDLSVLVQDRCELLRDVWVHSPLVPVERGLERATPDPRHPCSR